jgi:8-oxo-dGTP pyrophosphatase MutT (NUDIX family)
MMGFSFTSDEFRSRAAERLLREPPNTHLRSDDDLNPDARAIPYDRVPQRAAVLVPVVARPAGLSLLLTQRIDTLASHPGQVAFPGGKVDHGDTDPVATALREAEEETGLAREFIEPIGFLDGYLTRTAYRVIPVVAMVREGFSLVPQKSEVAAVFEVPLPFLMSIENHALHSREWEGKTRQFYAMPYEGRYIWGATAGMIRNLFDRMYAAP